MKKGEVPLRAFIQGDLREQIDEVWRKAERYQNVQEGDVDNRRNHCLRVEDNLKVLIPDETKEIGFTQLDLFLLSATACLHDIGRIIEDYVPGWEPKHGRRSAEIILKHFGDLGLDKGQAHAISHIAAVHDDCDLSELPFEGMPVGNEEINLFKIGSVFILADILDTTYQRIPEIVKKIKFGDGDVPPKWKARDSVIGWTLDEEGRIILHAAPGIESMADVCTLHGMLGEEVVRITPHLKRFGLPSELGELRLTMELIDIELEKSAVSIRPFPGMANYRKEDAGIFKGREKEIGLLISNVHNYPVSTLIGESGAGKTSLIQAGVFPRLELMNWGIIWVRPGDNPAENILNTIWGTYFEGKPGKDLVLLDVIKKAAGLFKPHKFLIALDQFEDVLNVQERVSIEDILRCLVTVESRTVIPNARFLISYREDASVRINSRYLKKVTGGVRQFPSVELERLTREGAKEAFLACMEKASIGIDSIREEGQEPLLDIILNDMQKRDGLLYPPDIQMVGETLCANVETETRLVTRGIYDGLGGAVNIVSKYLISLLAEFGGDKEIAEKVLVSLTGSQGAKTQKSFTELRDDLGIEAAELNNVIERLIDLRIVSRISENRFEIVHDHLCRIIVEDMMKDEDKTIKYLCEQLGSFLEDFIVCGTPITSTPFLARLYENRTALGGLEGMDDLILSTCLIKEINPVGWYWLRDIPKDDLYNRIRRLTEHEHPLVREGAITELAKLADPADIKYALKLINDGDGKVRFVAAKELEHFVNSENKSEILPLLKSEHGFIRAGASNALADVVSRSEWELLISMLDDQEHAVITAVRKALAKIVEPGDIGYLMKTLAQKWYYVRDNASEILTPLSSVLTINDVEPFIMSEKERLVKFGAKLIPVAAKPGDEGILRRFLGYNPPGLSSFPFDFYVKPYSILSLAQLGDEDSVFRALAILKDPKGSTITTDILTPVIGLLTAPEYRPDLVGLLSHESTDVKIAAANALANIRYEEDIPLLIETMRSLKWYNRDEFANDIKPWLSTGFVSVLMGLLEDDDPYIRCFALSIFAESVAEIPKPMLFRFLKDESFQVRFKALEILAGVLSDKEIEGLLNSLASLSQGWGPEQKRSLALLSWLDRRSYHP